ncbi:hypothetical protein H113_01404 [Trichophyton rubrum MR1459]|uniref:Uncharacterized protein n=2 Tax=Trichophyton TaxID=5550 RepID=A0A022WDG2_TRIRU|nr:hypothetical protein H100_01395 [Trichophyton rubrum MR850]EZF45509.1 hypothetical protein H102_01390 [Trichophyton rubrum CBS 100081]EZF56156.1 hypothetical protein H103_01400 [Trichophyton rubrum CBS 288.86]EZF66767.1 hypothetical protein H104_01380 [Trichophyton rubrum CBS 289.86]EZF77400.1 hypothetical protein H105_01410 [Trichophyton soudanense CBS 452.61]EZF88055.1 hypothetical protein H110_01399 [Trichophyton rubrum MR1448]EZF98844.1 hypothetical protein H113_01404 [Trichophyton rub
MQEFDPQFIQNVHPIKEILDLGTELILCILVYGAERRGGGIGRIARSGGTGGEEEEGENVGGGGGGDDDEKEDENAGSSMLFLITTLTRHGENDASLRS